MSLIFICLMKQFIFHCSLWHFSPTHASAILNCEYFQWRVENTQNKNSNIKNRTSIKEGRHSLNKTTCILGNVVKKPTGFLGKRTLSSTRNGLLNMKWKCDWLPHSSCFSLKTPEQASLTTAEKKEANGKDPKTALPLMATWATF